MPPCPMLPQGSIRGSVSSLSPHHSFLFLFELGRRMTMGRKCPSTRPAAPHCQVVTIAGQLRSIFRLCPTPLLVRHDAQTSPTDHWEITNLILWKWPADVTKRFPVVPLTPPGELSHGRKARFARRGRRTTEQMPTTFVLGQPLSTRRCRCVTRRERTIGLARWSWLSSPAH